MTAFLSRFELEKRGSTVGRELRGALATFLTMSYIVFVNPLILGSAGMPKDVVNSLGPCTALAAGICCILMGLVSNFPIALASGMGLNAIVAGIAVKAGSWQVAMGLIVIDGLTLVVLTASGLRQAVMHAIPKSLRLATGAGIGLFIALIGLVHAKIVVGIPIPDAPLTHGSWRDPTTAVALIGLLITIVLMARRVTGAIILGIIATTIVAIPFHIVHLPEPGESWRPTFHAAFHADVMGAIKWPGTLAFLFAVVMVDFFDTIGTATAIAEEADLMDDKGRIPGVRAILLVDSISASIGGLFGVSSVTCYIESASGVAEGARTGLHSVFVGILFLLAIIAAPIARIVPDAATAPALILVGFFMLSHIGRIDFDDLEGAIPAFITLLTIPLTYSIAHGIGYGFITYVAIKVLCGRFREVHALMYVVAAAFATYFLFGAT